MPDFQNINLPVVVPRLDIAMEDAVIAFGTGMIGNAVSSLLSYISSIASVLMMLLSFVAAIGLVRFAQTKRKIEIEVRGASRTGMLRKYLTYWFNADKLRGR